MGFKRVNISLPEEVLKHLDNAAKEQGQSRSSYIVDAVIVRRDWQIIVEGHAYDYASAERLLATIRDQAFMRHVRAARKLSWQDAQD